MTTIPSAKSTTISSTTIFPRFNLFAIVITPELWIYKKDLHLSDFKKQFKEFQL